MKIHLDFETRSELNIKKVGGWVYSNHPSTDVLCLASAYDDQEVLLHTRELIAKAPVDFINRPKKEVLFVAHNAMF